MTDTDTITYVLFGEHAENLASGALIAPGDRVSSADLAEGDQWLIDDGKLRDLADCEPTPAEVAEADDQPKLLAGEALTARAEELDIPGRSTMSADEKRAAIERFENEGGLPAEEA